MTFLNTMFDDEEVAILKEFIEKNNLAISIFYSIDTNALAGVENPNRMIFVGGLYLLEEKDEPKEWYIGQLSNGVYDFWANYGSLKDALYGL